MAYTLKRELNKIVDVYNNRIIKFVLLNGVLKAYLVTFFISLLFVLLGSTDQTFKEMILNILVRVGISTIPGIIWGSVEYTMYKDVIDANKRFTINNALCLILYGVFGWGLICGLCNVIFFPYSINSLVIGLTSMPFYGLILGVISKKAFNSQAIKRLYEENIKGRNIKSVKINKKNFKMVNTK